MKNLLKIKSVTSRFGITARTLRYYEDIGLITSIRNEDYAHRLYDEAAIMRLKQILILRKLNISIKDIKHIFEASGSEIVLEILGKRADDIDNEVALLHELRGIILDFINQIKQADFHNDTDVKLLYDKAKAIETQIATADYNGNPTSVNRLLEVTEELEDKRKVPPLAIKTYKQSIGPMRFIGKKYLSGAEAWKAWDENPDDFLKNKIGVNLKDLYEDGDAIIGLMNQRGGFENFEYWLGHFAPENTPVPEGFEYEDFPKKDIGICWLYGHADEVFAVEPIAFDKLKEEGFDVDDTWWFERYHPIRMQADKKGNVIIDICFFMN